MIRTLLLPIIIALDATGNKKILLNNEDLPFVELTYNNTQPIDQVALLISIVAKIPREWLDIKYVGCYLDNNHLYMYFNTYIPNDYIDESIKDKFTYNINHLPHHAIKAIMEG